MRALVFLCLVGCASGWVGDPPAARTLRVLRARLDRLHQYPRSATVNAGGDLSVADLVGVPQREIRDALGAPRTCTERQRPAPCRRPGDWFYSFYQLPETETTISLGGGPELWLQFDAQGVCTRAEWAMTQ